MPIRSKLMLGLLVFSTLPLVVLGWFLCAHVNRARQTAVMQIQVAGEKSIEQMQRLNWRAAAQRANEVAGEIAGFLRSHPDAALSELGSVEALRHAAQEQSTIGCVTSIQLLLDDKPVKLTEFGLARCDPPGDPPGANAKSKRYTHVASVPGSRLKVAVTTQDMGLTRPIDQLAREIRGIGTRTEKGAARTLENLKLMLVLGVTGLVVALTMAGGQIARSITRPILKLTTMAEAISAGRRDVDVEVSGGREIQLLASAFKKATGDLQEYAASLEQHNLELDIARQRAVKANHELQEAQDEMIQMEKMSSLGRLVAGVAHEINTPTGAIYNVTAEASDALDVLVAGLHRMRDMSPEEFQQFRHYLDTAVDRRLIPERVSRRDRRRLSEMLEATGLETPQKYVELLARCHITSPDHAADLSRLLDKYNAVPVFTALVEIHAGMKISRTSAQKISRIVRALKFYSRGGENQSCGPTDINQTVHDALIILHNQLKDSVDLSVELAEGLPQPTCTDGITEVWVNLLTNACDAISDRGPGFRGKIWIHSQCDRGEIHVTVADNGAPVPAEIASKIFDPFFTTKPPGKGTGLGLAVVVGTVRRNGGNVNLTVRDEFKEFEVTLPVEMPAHAGASI